MDLLHVFPHLNASLNALSGVFLITGFVSIMLTKVRVHRVAMLAAILALASFWFAPQNQSTPAVATHSPDETAFIQRSLKKHDNYVVTQPKDGAPAIRAGEGGSAEGEASAKNDYVP